MYKSKLQELCHRYSMNLPEYTTVKDGPDHNPRFTATVTVNGIPFQIPSNQCRSAKEAQNQAAKLAFDHFTHPQHHLLQHSAPLPNATFPSSSSGFSASNANLDIPANSGILEPIEQVNVQNFQTIETTLGSKDDKRSKDILHLCKNRLQNYAQKRNLSLPMYSCEIDGPPHARRFKSRVTINEKTFETLDSFPTIKEAEQAAAKVALESLSLDQIQEGQALYKSLLQELSQKEGFCLPAYDTKKSGPPHYPTFVSTVEVGGESFQGMEGKTKKQAEMNAAKDAYAYLTERRERLNPAVLSSGCHIKRALEVPSSNLQSVITDESQLNVRPEANLLIQEDQAEEDKGRARWNPAALSAGCTIKRALEFSSSNLQSVATDESQLNVRPEANLLIQEDQAEEDKEIDINAKRYRYSSSMNVEHAPLLDSLPSAYFSPKDGLSLPSTPLEYSTNLESDAETQAEGRTLALHKVLVCARKPNITYPEGATVSQFSDDKWMAVTMDMNQNQ